MATATGSGTSQLTFGHRLRTDPAFTAFWILRAGFIILPLLMGIDKFTNLMVDWPSYLAPWIANISPLVTSDLVSVSIRSLTATLPPTCVARPAMPSRGLIASYSVRLSLSLSAVRRITRYVACPSRDTSPGTPS